MWGLCYSSVVIFSGAMLMRCMHYMQIVRNRATSANIQRLTDGEDIVHGDIKPDNVIAFYDHGAPVRLADFGYATHYTDFNKYAKMPFSPPFTAPEHHHRFFNVDQAKMMDIDSLGMLLLWLLFKGLWSDLPHHFVSETSETGSSNVSQTSKISSSSVESNLGDMVTFAMRNLEERHDCSEDDKARLRRIFSQALAVDPMYRNIDIEELMYILKDEYGTTHHLKIFGLI